MIYNYIIYTMKNLQTYIIERLGFKEKVSFNVYKILNKIFGLDKPTTEVEAIKNIKSFVEKQSNGEITLGIKRAKEIARDISNCVNKDEHLFGAMSNSEPTIKECFESMIWANEGEMTDDWQFIVYYKKDEPNKFVVDDESPYIIARKRADGTRPIKTWIDDVWDEHISKTYPKDADDWSWPNRIVWEYIFMLQDFDTYKERVETREKTMEIERRNAIKERIKNLENALKTLKNELEQ